MIVEICANSFASAFNAERAGAHRIELCSELAVGGITPSYGLIKHVKDILSIPVFVLIRPRGGNFTYSEAEFDIMKQDIIMCKELGCEGIVSGVLNQDYTIDLKRTEELVALSKPLPFIFHRAFDWIPNIEVGLNSLINLGVKRVLTSGQETLAIVGLKKLEQLKAQAQGKITILPGGGISLENVLRFKQAGFKEIHCSLSRFNSNIVKPKISMNSLEHYDEDKLATSDFEKIKALIDFIK